MKQVISKSRWIAAATVVLLAISIGCCALVGCTNSSASSGKVHIKLLVLPHFETGKMYGDIIGEAQLIYEEYLVDSSKEYELANGQTCYVNEKEGFALCLTGESKAVAASCMATLLNDQRFDFSDAYILAVGCAGGNMDYTTLGDVSLVTATVDYDLCNRCDTSELDDPSTQSRWYPFGETLEYAYAQLNVDLINKVYELTKDVSLSTTPNTQDALKEFYPTRECSARGPKVIKGTTVTGDCYWKGKVGHSDALGMVAYYGATDPYATTEMEDMAVMTVAQQYGKADKTIILRAVVNADEFLPGDTPSTLWGDIEVNKDLSNDRIDIFDTAMNNMQLVTARIVEAIMNDNLK